MSAFAGTAHLVRLFLRRDRIRIPVWIAAIVVLTLASAASVVELYDTPRELQEFAAIAESNPAIAALNGRPAGLDTIGGRVSFEVLVFVSATAALMSLLLVGRHTRAEEEAGRTELLLSGAVGSHAPTAAALLVVTAVNVLVGAGVALGLASLDLPLAGSWVLGASVATVGIVFAAVAAVTAQVSEHSRGAGGLAGAALGAAYALRAAGDVGSGALSWLSPIGWAQYAEPYAHDRLWPLLLGLAVAAGLTAAAFWLVDRRDVGSGFLATRPGPSHAPRLLGSPLGLALRLQRATLAGWTAGVTFFGVVYGTVGLEIEELLESTPEIADYLATAGEGTLTESYFATVALQLGLLTTGYVIQGLLRLRAEEADGRAELVLGKPVSRRRWAGAHVLVVAAGSVVVLAVSGAATGLVHGLRAGELSWVPELVVAQLAQLPAVWVVAGLALLLYGVSTRLALLGWAALAAAVVVGFFAEPLQLPDWARDLSPFTHLPQVPAADLTVGAPAALLLIATALCLLALEALSRRDITTT